MKKEKIYEMIDFIVQQNIYLNKEYEKEVYRGINAGIYDKNDKITR